MGVMDLSTLAYPNEPSVLEVLRVRFEQELIYTWGAAGTLIAINPFKPVSILSDPSVLASYKMCLQGEDDQIFAMQQDEEPHVYAICRRTARLQQRTHRNYSFVIQGESGAGT